MNIINQKVQSGERTLFKCKDTKITHTIFGNGESPLKGSSNIELQDSILKWKYPFWYSNKIKIDDSLLQDGARAGIWYTDEIEVSDTVIEAPKAFRRCKQIKLHYVDMPNANETLWMCQDVEMINVTAKGDYFAMNTSNITAENFNLVGNYSFDGGKNITMTHSKLLSKDAFWNCDNIIVKDSFISGEYIGWNSRNLTFINCTIESLQGFCYIDGLTLINCRLLNTTLAFEYCKNINIDVTTTINSIKNPINGTICSAGIDNIIFDDPNINPHNTLITLRNS